MRIHLTIVLGVVLAWAAGAARARPENVFFIGGKERPSRAVVTVGEVLEGEPARRSEMVGMLHGVLADLTGQELGQLLATPQPRTKLLDARGNLERVGVVHLFGRSGVKRVELLSGNEGVFLAQELDGGADGEERVAKLDPERFRRVLLGWPRYRGAVEGGASEPAPGEQAELGKPYSQGPFYMDQEGLGDRFLRGKRSQIPGVARLLGEETMFVRVPREYDARHPAGLLVWINAVDDGRVPPMFDAALDELGIVAVGVQGIGNTRPVADRYQMAIDAAWTAMGRYHIDPSRVYVTGISGGGRVSSMLLACFPDYFTGAAPIVGLSAYFNVPVGNGRYTPSGYSRPDAKMWSLTKSRPMGVITGDGDFNAVEIREAARRMSRDGMEVRVFDYKELGHEMPSAEQFSEVMRWVDAPARGARAKEAEAAGAALAKLGERIAAQRAGDERLAGELMKVTEVAPWSAAAWEAVGVMRRLGVEGVK